MASQAPKQKGFIASALDSLNYAIDELEAVVGQLDNVTTPLRFFPPEVGLEKVEERDIEAGSDVAQRIVVAKERIYTKTKHINTIISQIDF